MIDRYAAGKDQRSTEASINTIRNPTENYETPAEVPMLKEKISTSLVKGSHLISPHAPLPHPLPQQPIQKGRVTFEFPPNFPEEKMKSLFEYLKQDGIHVVDDSPTGSGMKRRRESHASEQEPRPLKQKQPQVLLGASRQNSQESDEVLIAQFACFQHVPRCKSQEPSKLYKCTLDSNCPWSSNDESSWVRHQHDHYPSDAYVCRHPDCGKKKIIIWWSSRRDVAFLHIKNHYGKNFLDLENQVDKMLQRGALRIPDNISRYPRTCVFFECSESFSTMQHRLHHTKAHFKQGDSIDDTKVDKHSRKVPASTSPAVKGPTDKDNEPRYDGDASDGAAGSPSPNTSGGSGKAKENHSSNIGPTGKGAPQNEGSGHAGYSHSPFRYLSELSDVARFTKIGPRMSLTKPEFISSIFHGHLRHRMIGETKAWVESTFSVMYSIILFPSFQEQEHVPDLTTGTTLDTNISKDNKRELQTTYQSLKRLGQVDWASDDSRIVPKAILEYSVPMVREPLHYNVNSYSRSQANILKDEHESYLTPYGIGQPRTQNVVEYLRQWDELWNLHTSQTRTSTSLNTREV